MTNFTSQEIKLEKSAAFTFHFLEDFNHFERLMPEQVTSWKSTADHCSFTIQGMATIEMEVGNKKEFSNITYVAVGSSPLKFSLEFNLQEIDETNSKTQIQLNADLNPMLKMMASRPLQNFVDLLAGKLKEVVEAHF
ncbi:MAG: hypothetical protein K9G76_04250 [Bacteroidales bacterium]|nr:hypothetical protein [Bacteroidales bacterium]MCF8403635.1 hypothetical protein [Bacteroidales bacterium]